MSFSSAEPLRLAILVERHFIPDCCAGRSKDYVAQVRGALRLWGAALGREPICSDFSIAGVQQLCGALRHAGHSVNQIRRCRTRVLTLWRYAHRRGLASRCEPVKVERVPALLALPSVDRPASPSRAFCVFQFAAPPGTVRHYFETVFGPEELADASPESITENRRVVRTLYQHYGRDVSLSELSTQLAVEHFEWLKSKGCSNWSINNVRKWWFAQWRHAAERGLVDTWPRLRARRVERESPDAWTLEEMRRIIAAADDWWRALLLLGYWTLQRKRALFGLPIRNVDLESGMVEFPASAIKNRGGLRCKVGDDAIAAIKKILVHCTKKQVHCSTNLFTWAHDQHTLNLQFDALLDAARVPRSRRKKLNKFHKLRRIGATHAVIRGGMSVVCDLLGHSSIYVTKRYIDTTQLPGHDVTRLLPCLTDVPLSLKETGT